MVFAISLPGLWDTINFTSRDMGYCVQYFVYFHGHLVLRKNNNGNICQFIRNTCQFTLRDMGYLVPAIQASIYVVQYLSKMQNYQLSLFKFRN